MQAFSIHNESIHLITIVKNTAPKFSQGKNPDIMFYRRIYAHTYIKQWEKEKKVCMKPLLSPVHCTPTALSFQRTPSALGKVHRLLSP